MFRILSDSACETTTYEQQVNREGLEEESPVDQSPVEEENQQEDDDDSKRTKVIVPAS